MRANVLWFTALLSAGHVAQAEPSAAIPPQGPCAAFGKVSPGQQWLKGDYRVLPVAPQQQDDMVQRVARGHAKKVSRAFAHAALGGQTLPKASYYYLIRVGHVGTRAASFGAVDYGADVNSDGVVYVSTFVLSPPTNERTEVAAILSSPTPISRVVSRCGSAA